MLGNIDGRNARLFNWLWFKYFPTIVFSVKKQEESKLICSCIFTQILLKRSMRFWYFVYPIYFKREYWVFVIQCLSVNTESMRYHRLLPQVKTWGGIFCFGPALWISKTLAFPKNHVQSKLTVHPLLFKIEQSSTSLVLKYLRHVFQSAVDDFCPVKYIRKWVFDGSTNRTHYYQDKASSHIFFTEHMMNFA